MPLIPVNPRPGKLRTRGVTEIRGPYCTPTGPRSPADILDAMGACVDGLKCAGGSFAPIPAEQVRALNDLADGFGA